MFLHWVVFVDALILILILIFKLRIGYEKCFNRAYLYKLSTDFVKTFFDKISTFISMFDFAPNAILLNCAKDLALYLFQYFCS